VAVTARASSSPYSENGRAPAPTLRPTGDIATPLTNRVATPPPGPPYWLAVTSRPSAPAAVDLHPYSRAVDIHVPQRKHLHIRWRLDSMAPGYQANGMSGQASSAKPSDLHVCRPLEPSSLSASRGTFHRPAAVDNSIISPGV